MSLKLHKLGGAQFVLEAQRPKVLSLWCGIQPSLRAKVANKFSPVAKTKFLFLFNFLSPHTVLPFILSLIVLTTSAQEQNNFELSRTIPGDIADFTVDNLGNIYLLSKDNRLKKVNANGDSLAVFNDVRRYGSISSIDATNPLKLLVYYRDFTMIIELDRYLNIINTIDLRNLSILQAKAVGLAYNNNIWVYDELDAKLKRIRDDGTLEDQTTDFRQLFDSVPDPSLIIDQGGLVYLYDIAKGVYVFDHYGGLKGRVALPGWKDFNVIDQSILGRVRQKFVKYKLGTLDVQEQDIPDAYRDAIKIRLTPTAHYVLRKTGLEIYSRR